MESGTCWWHIILNARGTWLPGDPRGFRSRNHRKYSSGDYLKPPPAGEYAGLHRVAASKAKRAVWFPQDLWSELGGAIVEKIDRQGFEVLVVSVDAAHAHVLVRLPEDRRQVKRLMGGWKQAASHRVRQRLPGRVWASSGDPVRIADRGHQVAVFGYILRHGERGAWVWRFDAEA